MTDAIFLYTTAFTFFIFFLFWDAGKVDVRNDVDRMFIRWINAAYPGRTEGFHLHCVRARIFTRPVHIRTHAYVQLTF